MEWIHSKTRQRIIGPIAPATPAKLDSSLSSTAESSFFTWFLPQIGKYVKAFSENQFRDRFFFTRIKHFSKAPDAIWIHTQNWIIFHSVNYKNSMKKRVYLSWLTYFWYSDYIYNGEPNPSLVIGNLRIKAAKCLKLLSSWAIYISPSTTNLELSWVVNKHASHARQS